ncbi:NUDIX hydrolase [Nonomuraea diastatica]|nr:NUDIX domain-containing protein [Nonomuraea diastatica]
MKPPVRRDTARIILVSSDDRVMLFRHHLPAPWAREGWLTPGGAIEPGESPAAGAARELREETGQTLSPAAASTAVALNSGEWSANGTMFTTVNWYFLSRTASENVDLSSQADYEHKGLLEHRWWTIADLELTRELVLPPGLACLLRQLLPGQPPEEPALLPWA